VKCINRYKQISVVICFCILLTGCSLIKYDNVVTEYETIAYDKNLYTGDFYASDICVATEDVSVEGFVHDDSLYASGLFDLTNAKVAFSNNIHEKVFPASTTKILTALVAMETCDLDEVVTISESAAASSFAYDEQVCRLREGDQLTLRALLNGLLIWSGNDAAVAIAEYVGGSIEEFASMMNNRAAELMATNTHFVTPNGLHDENHYTTAYDLYLIFKECIKHEDFITIVSADSYVADIKGKDGVERQEKWIPTSFYARDLVMEPEGAKVIGGKTGYTGEAGNCLILLNEDENGKYYISIVMGADDKPLLYEDMTEIINLIPNI